MEEYARSVGGLHRKLMQYSLPKKVKPSSSILGETEELHSVSAYVFVPSLPETCNVIRTAARDIWPVFVSIKITTQMVTVAMIVSLHPPQDHPRRLRTYITSPAPAVQRVAGGIDRLPDRFRGDRDPLGANRSEKRCFKLSQKAPKTTNVAKTLGITWASELAPHPRMAIDITNQSGLIGGEKFH